jgi:hypothetical protein
MDTLTLLGTYTYNKTPFFLASHFVPLQAPPPMDIESNHHQPTLVAFLITMNFIIL